jgi:serine/threonine protein kinase
LSEGFQLLGEFAPGTLVAGYRVEESLGAGGMAVVYRARDERLGRMVALKVLGPALAADEEFRRRFIAESRAAAAVDHPNIVPVYEAGRAGDALFIAMRLVTGGDLRQVLDREGPLPPARAAQFLSPVASALDAAHRAGLVHRDVKPANILVDRQPDRPEHVYLSDFGISQGTGSAAGLTGSAQYLGTPEYTSPEQVKGRPVDGRADQYALACIAWHLLTGRSPSGVTWAWPCCSRTCTSPCRHWTPCSSCPRPPGRCWPGHWPRIRGSGTRRAASSPTRCATHSPCHRTGPRPPGWLGMRLRSGTWAVQTPSRPHAPPPRAERPASWPGPAGEAGGAGTLRSRSQARSWQRQRPSPSS